MTLVQQFPDISEEMRSKNKTNDKNYRSANAKQLLSFSEEKAAAKYYEGEFRRWHIKFVFIVGATLGLISFILLKSFWIYNLLSRE
jgi:hypothetical protein